MNDPRDRVYFVLRCGTAEALALAVEAMSAKGLWRPLGGVCYAAGLAEPWAQAMVRSPQRP